MQLILLAVVIVLFTDALPQFQTWQSRIHIGRHANRQNWHKKVLHTSRAWLRNIPTVKLTDNNRLIIIDILRGQYQRAAIQSWQEAALVLGLGEEVRANGNLNMEQQIQQFITAKVTASGKWKVKPAESDHAMLAYGFLNCDFIDHNKYRAAYDETWQMIRSLKGEDGTVAYKSYKQDFRFVDTVGFICPFLIKYGVRYSVPEAVDLAVTQILEYQKYGMMPGENIPCHTYHTDTKIPTGLCGWGRGLGWWVLGLADSWQALPTLHPAKKTFEQLMIKTARSAMKFQDTNGGYHWLLFDPASRVDSSTVASIAWFCSVAEDIPEIAADCRAAKEKALTYLQVVTRRNGAVDFSQGDTKGIGVYSQNFDILPFTQGLVLRTLNYQPKPKPKPQP